MSILEERKEAITNSDSSAAKQLTEKGLGEGIKPADFFPGAIIPAMDEVGGQMGECGFFISKVLIAARAARGSAGMLGPLLAGVPSQRPSGHSRQEFDTRPSTARPRSFRVSGT